MKIMTLILISFVLCCPPCPAEDLKPAIQVKYTYKDLWRATKRKSSYFLHHLVPTAKNINENWESIKKTWRDSGPYVQPVAAATGVLYNVNNFKIRN